MYEAGPCGFVLQRHFNALGWDCDVVAPSSIPRPSGGRIKTDRRDAMKLARLVRANELAVVRAVLSTGPAECMQCPRCGPTLIVRPLCCGLHGWVARRALLMPSCRVPCTAG